MINNTSTRIWTNCVIKPEISTKRKGTCPHLWRYLISDRRCRSRKNTCRYFYPFHVTRDNVTCPFVWWGVWMLGQQIGRSGHGENVMESCVGVWGLWNSGYIYISTSIHSIPWHDVTKDGLSSQDLISQGLGQKWIINTVIVSRLVAVGRVTMMENTKSYYCLVPVCHLAIFGHQQLSSHHSHQLSLADGPSHSGDMRRVRSIVCR